MTAASAIYTGQVHHRRHAPVPHAFRYPLCMLYLDLDELPTLSPQSWLWSTRRRAAIRFAREDHAGDPLVPLAETIRQQVAEATGSRPTGPIRLLTQPRYWGYVFNPISVYYCFDAAGQQVEAVLAEVTNTPWGDRHCYVLSGDCLSDPTFTARRPFAKAMHVSPFLPMGLTYHWQSNFPGDHLQIHMDVLDGPALLFDATLSLRRQPFTASSLRRLLWRFPFMTARVVAAIYWQALRLWLKRVPCFGHPGKLAAADAETGASALAATARLENSSLVVPSASVSVEPRAHE